MLERLERELMLIARCSVMTPRKDTKDGGKGSKDGKAKDEARLDRSAFLLLSRLDAEGAMSIGQLADAFGLDVSTVNRQTAALLRCGLLERIPDPEGGLARKLRVTGHGAERLDTERDIRRAGLERVLADWSDEDVASLTEQLTRFNRQVEECEGREWPREREPAGS